ncbi:hypothetical protein F66182_3808 [Fusarium sp. NRRL 66182]|nr:hypothetical protein F66182_3808 [Fusarium sp. NRRL 66182]
MRPPNIHLVGILLTFLLLSCLFGIATGFGRQQHPGDRRDGFIKARKPDGDEPAHAYGSPPPYYTGEPVLPTDLSSYSTFQESTPGSAVQTGTSSEAGTAFQSDVSSLFTTASAEISSISISSALETDATMVSVDSSAKGGSATGSETASATYFTSSVSYSLSESLSSGKYLVSEGQYSTALGNSSSSPSTRPLDSTETTLDVSSATGMPGNASLSSLSALPTAVSSIFVETETATVSTDSSLSLQASDTAAETGLTSSEAETESRSNTIISAPLSSGTTDIESVTTTTKIFSVTVTVPAADSTGSGLTLSSTPNGSSHPSTSIPSPTLSISPSQSTTGTITLAQNSSQISTERPTGSTVSEEYLSSGSLASGIIGNITSQSDLTETVSGSRLTESASLHSSTSLTGSLSFIATTYLNTTYIISTVSTDFSGSSERSSAPIASNGSLSNAGTGELSATLISRTVTDSSTISSIASMSGVSSASIFTSLASNSSGYPVSTSKLSGSIGESESTVSTKSVQTSSGFSFGSSALPVNTTSGASTISFTVVTVSESVITILPGNVPPTGTVSDATNSSVSTAYSTSTPWRFNSSMASEDLSSSRTSSLLDWPTWTMTEPRTSVSLDFPSISMPTSEFSIITTPLIPPNVTSTSTEDVSISLIKTTWTSTITTSIAPTKLAPSQNATVAHTTSGYNFSETLGSGLNTFSSFSTSFASIPGISTSLITRQPTDLPFPFPSNTTIVWRSTASLGSFSQTIKTLSSQGPEMTWSAASSGFSSSIPSSKENTAPYGNSTATTATESFSPSSRANTASTVTATTYHSWNTTSTTFPAPVSSAWSQGPVWNSTRTMTESSLSAENGTWGVTSTITPPFPSLNGTLTTVSNNAESQTFADISLTIITPSFSVPFNDSITSLPLSSTPPFPWPSNSTATGTDVPSSPSGTGPRPTSTSTLGELPTVGTVSTLTINTSYYFPNTSLPRTTAESSGPVSVSGANTPFFPISNSTAATTATVTANFSSIPSWTANPEPWTTWPTWSLTEAPDRTTSTATSLFSTGNSSRYLSSPTSYTRTTTLLLTTTLTPSTSSQVTIGNSSDYVSSSTSYSSTTTVLLTTTLTPSRTAQATAGNSSDGYSSSISYTRTTTVLLTTTVMPSSTSQVSRPATSSSTTWANTTSEFTGMSQTAITSLSTLLSSMSAESNALPITTSDLTEEPPTTILSSALTPFPVSNSTVSQASDRKTSGMGTQLETCSSTTTASSTCTDSLYHSPYYPQSWTVSTSTDCSTAASRTASQWSHSPISTIPDQASSTCNTTTSMSSYSTVHWANGTHTFEVKGVSTYQSLTTLRTITTAKGEGSGSAGESYPTPTDRVAPSDSLPDDPNFPWGNDSPVHRHQNVSGLNIGTGDEDLGKRTDWHLGWEHVKAKLKSLWHGQALEAGG